MPELPEVETIVREMHAASLIGLKVQKAEIIWERTIGYPDAQTFTDLIKNQTLLEIKRRGKYIVLVLSKSTLLIHLRMTGKLLIEDKNRSFHPFERVRLHLSDGRILRYEDQ